MPKNKHFKSDQVVVTDSAVALFDTNIDSGLEFYGYVKNIGNECIYVGNGNVTSDCGYELDSREKLELRFFDHNDSLSAICKSEESSNVCWFLAAYG